MFRVSYLFLFTASVLLSVYGLVHANDEIENKLQAAREAERNQNWQLAQSNYQSVLEDSVALPEAWAGLWRSSAAIEVQGVEKSALSENEMNISLAGIYEKYYQYPRAARYYEAALRRSRDDFKLVKAVVNVYSAMGNDERGRIICREYSERMAHELSVHVELARFYETQGWYDRALFEYQFIAEKNPGFAALEYADFGRAYEHTGDLQKAVDIYRKGIEQRNDRDCLSRLIDLYKEQQDYDNALLIAQKYGGELFELETHLKFNRYDRAFRFLQEKIEQHPGQVKYYRWLSTLYIGKNKIDMAEQIIVKGMDANPDQKNELLLELGDLFSKKGEYSRAIGYYTKSPEQGVSVKRRIIRNHILNDDISEARELATEIIAARKMNHLQAGKIFEDNGKINEAIYFYADGLAIYPDNFELRITYAEALEQSNRFREALSVISAGLEGDRGFLASQSDRIVKLVNRLGRGKLALQHAIKNLLSLNNPALIGKREYYQPFVDAALELDKQGSAIALLKTVSFAYPKNSEIYSQLAAIYERNNEWKSAYYYYRTAYESNPRKVFFKYKAARMLQAAAEKQRALDFMQNYNRQSGLAHLNTYFLSRFLYETGKYREALLLMNKSLPQSFWDENEMKMVYVYDLKAKILDAMGLYGEAEKVLQENVRTFPDDQNALLSLADYQFRRGEFAEAEATYRKLQEVTGTQTKFVRQIAECFIFQNKSEEAFELVNRIADKDQLNRAAYLHFKGNLAQFIYDFDKAIDYYRQELKLNPDDQYALYSSALAKEQMCKYREAINYYKEALHLDTLNYKYEDLGDIHRKLLQYNKALNYYRLDFEQNPSQISLLYKQALCHIGLGQRSEVDEIIARLSEYPESVERYYNEGKIHEKLDQLELAEYNYLEALLRKPGDLDVIIALASLYEKMGMYLKAEIWYQKYFNFAPQHPYYIDRLASFYSGVQEYELAKTWYESVLENHPWYHWAEGNLGLNYLYQGMTEPALRYLSNVAEAHPEAHLYVRGLARAYLQNNDKSRAARLLKDLAKDHPYNVPAYMDYVHYLLFYEKNISKARTEFARLEKFAPYDHQVQALKLMIKAMQGETEAAIDALIEQKMHYHERNQQALAQIFLYLAVINEKKGDYLRRRNYLERAQSLNSNDFWTQQFISRDLSVADDVPEVFLDEDTEKLTVRQYELEKSINPLTQQGSAQYVRSPEIIVTSPADGDEIDEATIDIKGYLPKNLGIKQLSVNGFPVKRIGMSESLGSSAGESFIPFRYPEFPLVSGVNFLKIEAYFENGARVEQTMRVRRINKVVTRTRQKSGNVRKTDRWAVVIGVSEYEDARLSDYRFDSQQANSVYQLLLTSVGGNFKKEHIRPLGFMTYGDADREAIQQKLGAFLGKNVSKEDIVLLYFAGSIGIDTGKDDGFYLIPEDVVWNQMPQSAIPDVRIAELLSRNEAKKIILVLNASFVRYDPENASASARFSKNAKLESQFAEKLSNLTSKEIQLIHTKNEIINYFK